MKNSLEQVALLLFVALLVAIIARRFRFPYAVVLVVTGLGLSLLTVGPVLDVTGDLLFTVLLPPLIFEGAMCLHWPTLRAQLPVVIALATLGVVLAAGVTGYVMHALGGWPMISALAFGALISATDPVSVIATFRELGIHGRLRLLAEAESLFNDGTAAVLFSAAVAFVASSAVTPAGIAANFLVSIGGGIASGVAIASVTRLLAGRIAHQLAIIALSVVAAYGSFLIAEHIGGSGVIATLMAGLVFGARRAAPDRKVVDAFWEFVAFAANSLVFLLIGMQEAQQGFSGVASIALLAILTVTIARATTVYSVAALFHRSGLRVPLSHQHVLVWGGLRGALALALALKLPKIVPQRGDIIAATFAVVAFSVIVQALSLPPLLRCLRIRTSARD